MEDYQLNIFNRIDHFFLALDRGERQARSLPVDLLYTNGRCEKKRKEMWYILIPSYGRSATIRSTTRE